MPGIDSGIERLRGVVAGGARERTVARLRIDTADKTTLKRRPALAVDMSVAVAARTAGFALGPDGRRRDGGVA